MKKLVDLQREFLEYIEIEKGRSLKTIENYDRYLRRFLEFARISSPVDITEESVRKYRLWLNRFQDANGNELSKKTQNYYVIALRSFLKFLARRDIDTLKAEKIELAKVAPHDLDLLSQADLEALLSTPKGNSEKTLRDRATLELFFSTGLRIAELCSLHVDDINIDRGEFSVRGKGSKIRVVFLSDDAKNALRAYLKKRSAVDDDRLFPVTPRSIQRMIHRYAIEAGIAKKVTPHVLRHAFATDLLQNGADLRSVQALLGHANISTTQIYAHFTDKQLGGVHRAFHGKTSK